MKTILIILLIALSVFSILMTLFVAPKISKFTKTEVISSRNTSPWLTDPKLHPYEKSLSSSAVVLNPSKQEQEQQRRIFVVFSTGCSASQDWQSQVLLHSYKVHNVSSTTHALVRLLSCSDANYPLPKQDSRSSSYYRVVRTPDFDSFFPHIRYSPRNRPGAMAYWLGGHSSDSDLPFPNDLVVAVDPDQLLTSSSINVGMVSHGHGVGSVYGLGNSVNTVEWIKPFLQYDDKSNHTSTGVIKNSNFGHPQMMTAYDSLRHARLWYNLTNDMKDLHDGWETEMYSNVVACWRLQIEMRAAPMMVSSTTATSEDVAWNALSWDLPRTKVVNPRTKVEVPIFVVHYCQRYQIGAYLLYKKIYPYKNYNMQDCKQDPRQVFPQPDERTSAILQRFRGERLMVENPRWSTNEANGARTVWMIDHAYGVVHRALQEYYDTFCLK